MRGALKKVSLDCDGLISRDTQTVNIGDRLLDPLLELHMSMAAIMMTLGLMATADAQQMPMTGSMGTQMTCPDVSSHPVSATMRTVTINGMVYNIRGNQNRTMFSNMLRQCGQLEAAKQFDQWRFNRRLTNASLGIGLFVFSPTLLASPVTAINAGMKKRNMLNALNRPTMEQMSMSPSGPAAGLQGMLPQPGMLPQQGSMDMQEMVPQQDTLDDQPPASDDATAR